MKREKEEEEKLDPCSPRGEKTISNQNMACEKQLE